ncbi:hypothetical protein TgHK011_001142 [Trichoderma gracile]|nr:hypothetical protein TgHK011_001142 [Trichoderma gracile]
MSAVQLSFSLRVSSGVKTVHLLGSWDNYVGQLPLAKDKTSKSGTWKGTFRFQNSTLEAGKRYWYYYIIDGYHIAHNPSVESTTEPTTGRELNILDVTESHKSGSKSSSRHSSSRDKSSRHRASLTVDIPKGRPLSISQIKAPKPMSPHATKHILESDYYGNEELEELTARFGSTGLDEDVLTDFSTSPVSSNGSSLSYRSDSSSPSSSLSGYSTPAPTAAPAPASATASPARASVSRSTAAAPDAATTTAPPARATSATTRSTTTRFLPMLPAATESLLRERLGPHALMIMTI